MEIIDWVGFLMPYEQAVNELKLKFSNLASDFKKQAQHSPIEHVDGRVKRVASILEKAHRKNIDYAHIAEKIEDIAGIRIICKFVEDIDKVVEMLHIRDGIDLTITQERDYITNTKPSGYRSYHILITYPLITTSGPFRVAAEIQIRTMSMDFWATIEHSIKYKYSGNLPDDLQTRLKNAAEASFQLDKEMGYIRGEIVEAQRVVQQRNDLVDQILRKVEKLHFMVKFDKANELNRQFMEIYEEGNLEKLQGFNQQLSLMAKLYNVQHS